MSEQYLKVPAGVLYLAYYALIVSAGMTPGAAMVAALHKDWILAIACGIPAVFCVVAIIYWIVYYKRIEIIA